MISTHSLTRRLTVSPRSTLSLLSYFNSQPHKEADVPASKCFFQKVISTHSLTRRLTIFYFSFSFLRDISTHSLTRRLTNISIKFEDYKKISTHSLTRRLTEERHRKEKLKWYFNSQPHKEADQTCHHFCCFQLFQLTASQGG